MKVITAYPVYANGKKIASGDAYMCADGSVVPTPKKEDAAKKKPGKKLKKAIDVAEGSGLLDKLADKLKKPAKGETKVEVVPVEVDNSGDSKGMSKGTKTFLIVGGVALLGAIIYVATKK